VCTCRPDRDSRGRVKSTKVSVEPPQEAVQDVVSHELEDLKVLDEVLAKARHVKVLLMCQYQRSSVSTY